MLSCGDSVFWYFPYLDVAAFVLAGNYVDWIYKSCFCECVVQESVRNMGQESGDYFSGSFPSRIYPATPSRVTVSPAFFVVVTPERNIAIFPIVPFPPCMFMSNTLSSELKAVQIGTDLI